MKKSALLMLLLIHLIECPGQDVADFEIIRSIAERLAASDTDPESAIAFMDRLNDLFNDPVNINSSTGNEIARLFFLSDFQVKALMDYVKSTGKIVSFNELYYIPGFDRATTEMIIPFCTLEENEQVIHDSLKAHSLLVTNLGLRSIKDDTLAMGSSLRLLTRYRFTSGRFSGGLTAEKDPGEKLFVPGTISPDFLSANLTYNGYGIIRKIILGDYSASFGHGTSINTGVARGLSIASQGSMSATNDIKPYTSTDENNFFRGIAAALTFKKAVLAALYSQKAIDASIKSSPGTAGIVIESFPATGLHDVSSAMMKRDAACETSYGLSFLYNFRSLRIGSAWSENHFSLPVFNTGGDPGNLFSFSGRSNRVFSMFYSGIFRKILIYGELSGNDPERHAIVQGISARPSERLTAGLNYREYSRGFTSFHGKGMLTSSGKYAEKALTGSFSFEAARHLFISGGCDLQWFTWLRYRCSSPSYGIRRELQLKYSPSDNLSLDGLFTYRLSMYDDKTENHVPQLSRLETRDLKITLKYSFNANLSLATRFDYKSVYPTGSNGVLLLEDLNLRFRTIPVSLWIRFCLFSSDDYDSRMYTWENDLLYTWSIPALYGKGSRFYIMAGWKISGIAELRVKYGLVSRNPVQGSLSNTEELRIQLKVSI